MQARERVREIVRGAGDDHRTSRGRPADLGERRAVGAEVLVAEFEARVARATVCDRLLQQTLGRQDAAAEREGARHDATVPVDHLDRELGAAERRVQRARRGQDGRGRSGQLRHFDCALMQRAVERTMEMTRDEHVDTRADDNDREQDPQRRRGDRAQPDRHSAHRNRKPVPRTVSINGGSPSFARRYETY